MKVLTAFAALLCFSGVAIGESQVDHVISDLEAVKADLMRLYARNGNVFPPTSNWEPRRRDSKHTNAISYVSGSPTNASVIATITGTGNPNLDGKRLAMFGSKLATGAVVWTCGTASSSTGLTPGALTAMYPYLPPNCRH